MLETGKGIWTDLNASFWNIWHFDYENQEGVGADLFKQGFDIWRSDIFYKNAERYFLLGLLGVVTYRAFK